MNVAAPPQVIKSLVPSRGDLDIVMSPPKLPPELVLQIAQIALDDHVPLSKQSPRRAMHCRGHSIPDSSSSDGHSLSSSSGVSIGIQALGSSTWTKGSDTTASGTLVFSLERRLTALKHVALNFSLTCKLLHQASQPYLYAFVQLTLPQRARSFMKDTLGNDPQKILRHTRFVWFGKRTWMEACELGSGSTTSKSAGRQSERSPQDAFSNPSRTKTQTYPSFFPTFQTSSTLLEISTSSPPRGSATMLSAANQPPLPPVYCPHLEEGAWASDTDLLGGLMVGHSFSTRPEGEWCYKQDVATATSGNGSTLPAPRRASEGDERPSVDRLQFAQLGVGGSLGRRRRLVYSYSIITPTLTGLFHRMLSKLPTIVELSITVRTDPQSLPATLQMFPC